MTKAKKTMINAIAEYECKIVEARKEATYWEIENSKFPHNNVVIHALNDCRLQLNLLIKLVVQYKRKLDIM